jgi:hypothetical protein
MAVFCLTIPYTPYKHQYVFDKVSYIRYHTIPYDTITLTFVKAFDFFARIAFIIIFVTDVSYISL